MHFSLNWIKEYIDLREKPDVIARVLTEHTFETEVVPEESCVDMTSIIATRVLDVTKHPNADRLSVVTVDAGKGRRESVVCGAPNVRKDMMVALAAPGAYVCSEEGGRMEVKNAEIRGVRSPGMICSERELGLSDRHEGIIELMSDVKVGTKLSVLFPRDTIIDVDVLPDRAADCSSHIGIARELGALLKRRVKLPRPKRLSSRGKTLFSVSVEDSADCARYVAVSVERIKNTASPRFIQQRLWAIGIRPQNLIVDATNYVLWETGQPTHAFDARDIGKEIGVRKANEDDKELQTLDGETRTLTPGTLLITSDDKPIALAGIMGGLDTAIKEDTQDIIVEAALFGRHTIRTSARETGLRTDASDRFSRGITLAHVDIGLSRVIDILTTYGGAEVRGYAEYSASRKGDNADTIRPEIFVPHSAVEDILGVKVRSVEVTQILRSLGFSLHGARDGYTVRAPEMRHDIMILEDVVEEIGRVRGYSNIPAVAPRAPVTASPLPSTIKDTRTVQDTLKGAGWIETKSYSFTPEEETNVIELDHVKHIGVINPINENQRRLRISLMPSMLHVVRTEIKRESVLRLFELGTVYLPKKGEERWVIGALARRSGDKKNIQEDFYEAKGMVEQLNDSLRVPDIRFVSASATPKRSFLSVWQRGAVAEIIIGRKEVGSIGVISRTVLEQLGIRGTVVAFMINVSLVEKTSRLERTYNPPLPYPVVRRDIALAVPVDVLVDDVFAAIQEAGGSLVQDIDIVDMHDEDDDSRGITVRILFGSLERTLTDTEVTDHQTKILAGLFDRLNVTERE